MNLGHVGCQVVMQNSAPLILVSPWLTLLLPHWFKTSLFIHLSALAAHSMNLNTHSDISRQSIPLQPWSRTVARTPPCMSNIGSWKHSLAPTKHTCLSATVKNFNMSIHKLWNMAGHLVYGKQPSSVVIEQVSKSLAKPKSHRWGPIHSTILSCLLAETISEQHLNGS